ncbi:hypothetical protein OG394_34870 [Kribbella sp. NBC_01245]|uniref:hypothetical protein n=1 Tax=Kribbella sp. NBC_01245 TaxID=2903578 RepID=UPI002E2C6AB6|nr:hypothetical protein [Kribbella sp. NBC_01245]
MTQTGNTERQRTVPGLGLDIDQVIDTPAQVSDAARATLDPQAVAIIECTEALAQYVEELHAPHGLDQFLTAAECAEVARFIDALGNNPARADEFFERRTGLALRSRNPEAGWNVETVREAVAQANNRHDALPDFARECFVLLNALIAYLDAFHGSTGFREVLTPTERQAVGNKITHLFT